MLTQGAAVLIQIKDCDPLTICGHPKRHHEYDGKVGEICGNIKDDLINFPQYRNQTIRCNVCNADLGTYEETDHIWAVGFEHHGAIDHAPFATRELVSLGIGSSIETHDYTPVISSVPERELAPV